MPAQPHTVKAPGASLYYETQGSGPVLLLIPGGPTDAGIFAGLAAELADRFTVVAVDPRGNSRSTFDAEPVEQDLDVHGDDMARVIDAVGEGPAFVLGSSGGAQIGLNLAARHPDKVKALVAHEPPCIALLPDADQVTAQTKDILDTYRAAGVGPAMQKFGEMAGLGGPPPQGEGQPPPPEQLAAFARIGGNMDYFVGQGIWPISTYRPDVDALKAGAPRIVVGVGETSKGQLAHRTGEALAQALGTEPVTFPGDHGGFGSHQKTFAEVLKRVLV
jgi:pimeloyl-ACP methyl ester carboxylesterase